MVGAKLFGIAAMLIGVFAPVIARLTVASLDFYLHDTYFVIAPPHAFLGLSLLCGVFAGFYYFGDRILRLQLSASLILAHFLFWIFAFAVLAVEEVSIIHTILRGQDPNQSWLLIVGGAAPVLSFIIGAGLFVLNLTRAIVLKLKTA